MRFTRGWWGSDLGSYRSAGILDDDTYGSLPPLPDHLFDGGFAWLTPQAVGPNARYMAANPIPAVRHNRPDHALVWDGLALPRSFVTFMANEVLPRSIPDTCNRWEMSMKPVRSPVERHAYLYRFLEDVQGCGYWYLHLGSDGTSSVLASAALVEPGGPDEDISSADFLHETIWVAPEFEQFVYRYWIESVARYQVVEKTPWDNLLPEVREYLGHYLKSDVAPLDVWPSPFPDEAAPGPAGLW